MTERIETAIIGGGQAGLAMSYHLSQLGREHVILEAKWPGHRWRTERWDAFAYQHPNWTLQLPGYGYRGDDPAPRYLERRRGGRDDMLYANQAEVRRAQVVSPTGRR